VIGKEDKVSRAQLAASVVAYQMLQDWVREGEAQRLSSSVGGAHAGGTAVRRLAHGLTRGVSALGRFFRVAHPEVQHGPLGRRVAYSAGSPEATRGT
jgi:hypothetical protein